MQGSAVPRRSGYWATVVGYGLAMAALVSILKYFEYRYWIRDLRVEVYIGVVAVLFTALGVWVGAKLLTSRRTEVVGTAPAREVNVEVVRALGISVREMEVLELMAQGHSNQQIADALFISLPTVKSHASNLFVKLDVRRRTQAVHKAKSLEIIA